MLFFVATFGMNFQVATALMSRACSTPARARSAWLRPPTRPGALGGALLAARRRHPSVRLQIAVALAFGILETASGLMPAYWAFLLLLLPTGLSVVMYTTAANSAIQLGTDPQLRGRVMGVYMLVFLGGAPIGSPLIGWVAEQFGPRMSLISGGVISAIAAIAVGIVFIRVTGTSVRDGLLATAAEAATNERMRLFVALAPPPAALDELEAAVAPLRPRGPGLRWTSRDAWHITLAFLGDVSETAAARLTPRLERAAARHPQFRLAFAGAGAFPSASRARVLWVGLNGDDGGDRQPGRVGRRRRAPRRGVPAGRRPGVPPAPHAGALPRPGRCPRPRRYPERLPGASLAHGPRSPDP